MAWQRTLLFLVALCVAVACDQLSKLWFEHHYVLHESHVVFPGFAWRLAHNEGAAFSILNEGKIWQQLILTVASLGVALVLFYWVIKQPLSRLERAAYFFIAAGAVGNVIDRLRLGYVIDFIDWYYDRWHWPTFNVADMYICFGAFLLVLSWFFSKKS